MSPGPISKRDQIDLTSFPLMVTFEIVDSVSCPGIFRQSSTTYLGGQLGSAQAYAAWVTRISIVPFSTGDIFSRVRFIL